MALQTWKNKEELFHAALPRRYLLLCRLFTRVRGIFDLIFIFYFFLRRLFVGIIVFFNNGSIESRENSFHSIPVSLFSLFSPPAGGDIFIHIFFLFIDAAIIDCVLCRISFMRLV